MGNKHLTDQKIFQFFFFAHVELNSAIKKQDLKKAKDVCVRANKNINFSWALIFVVENELSDMYDMLMKYGARFNIHNKTGGEMLFVAVSKQNVRLCIKLFRDGMTENTKNCPNPSMYFKMAIRKIIEDELLVNYVGNVNSLIGNKNKTLIHDIINRRNYALCEKFITEGIDISTKDSEGNSPLHVAAEVNDVDIINLLIENKVDVNARNNTQQTALHLAAQNGCKEAFDTLRKLCDDDDCAVRLYVENLPWYS